MTTLDLEALRRDVEALGDELTPKEKADLLRDLAELERIAQEHIPPPKPPLGARIYAALNRLFKSDRPAAMPEVDPLAEANVYASYGRLDQAIEILEQAHRAQPDRHDIASKLTELRATR